MNDETTAAKEVTAAASNAGVMDKFVMSVLDEQRKSRFWSNIFKGLTFTYLFVMIILATNMLDFGGSKSGPHTAMVTISGVIGSDGQASAASVIPSLREAFNDENTKGLIIKINSPGGSPVQAGMINDEVRRLKALHPKIPVYAVVEDICASGGYYIAVAADKIYVNKASIVGSIGVIMDGFGFDKTMSMFGVERRAITSGKNKALLDPFSPLNPDHAAFAKEMLTEVHQQFIDVVKQGRGARIKDDGEVFTGLFWVGTKSIKKGLADEFGSVDSVARDVIKQETIVDYTEKENFVKKVARKIGTEAMHSIVEEATFSMR